MRLRAAKRLIRRRLYASSPDDTIVLGCQLAQPMRNGIRGEGAAPTTTNTLVPAQTGLRFEWDATKGAVNQNKHGMSFDEAKTVFF